MNVLLQSLRHRARYNKRVNEEISHLLYMLPEESLSVQRGAYYQSILGILNHLLQSDINLLRRFRVFDNSSEYLRHPHLLPEGSCWHSYLMETWTTWKQKRLELDLLIIRWIDQLDDGVLAIVRDYHDSKNRLRKEPLWMLIDHMFNHQTHHRGQLSQILDESGVEHDYSGLPG